MTADPRSAAAGHAPAAGPLALARQCVQLGFCTSACPTYALTRDERDSPRGRILLLRAMFERGGAPDAETVHFIDRCLSCLACTSTCAVDVDYMHLVDQGREYIARHHRRPLAERTLRALLMAVLPRPRLFAAALRLAQSALPVQRFLPAPLAALLAIAAGARIAGSPLPAATHPAAGARRGRVALATGCVQQVLRPEINTATIRLLQRNGWDVVVAAGAGCCGALNLHLGDADGGRGHAARCVDAWQAAAQADGLDAIIVNAAGCGTVIKDYGQVFAADTARSDPAHRIAALACDVTEFLARTGTVPPVVGIDATVAYHDACSLRNGQKVTRQPRRLLQDAGLKVLEVADAHMCCGSAGSYNLLQPQAAAELRARKVAAITATGAAVLAAGNIGCLSQLQPYVGIPAVHTVELLDWLSGGPAPPALAHVATRPVAPPCAKEQAPPAPVAAGDTVSTEVGFW